MWSAFLHLPFIDADCFLAFALPFDDVHWFVLHLPFLFNTLWFSFIKFCSIFKFAFSVLPHTSYL